MHDKIKCLICGKSFTRVCSHVWQVHGMSAREYKEEFGLDRTKGIIPESLRSTMSEYAKFHKMGEQLKKVGVSTRFKKGDPTIGKYKRSNQTLEKLKTRFDNYHEKTGHGPVEIICKQCGNSKMVVYSARNQIYCSAHCFMVDRHANKIKKTNV